MMTKWVVRFPEKYRTTPHPILGMRPYLPEEVAYFELPDSWDSQSIRAKLNKVLTEDGWHSYEEWSPGSEGHEVVLRATSDTIYFSPMVKPLTFEAQDVVSVLNGHQTIMRPDEEISCSCDPTLIFMLPEEYSEHVGLQFMELRKQN